MYYIISKRVVTMPLDRSKKILYLNGIQKTDSVRRFFSYDTKYAHFTLKYLLYI